MTWLLAWLWQGIAIALAIGVLLRLARRLNAATRHMVWWTTLGVVLTLPLVLAGGDRRLPATPSGPATAVTPFVVSVVIPDVPDWAVSIAIGGWLGLVLMRLAGVARSFASLDRLKGGCAPMPVERERRLGGWMSVRREARQAALMLSDEVPLPSALGLGRPVIALPRGLAAELTDEDLDRVVLHEWAHLRRYDDWKRLGQALIESVAGLHPAVWWIGRMIDIEREAACDDFVVSHTGEMKCYASCLVRVAERSREVSATPPVAEHLLAPGVARAGRQLRYRVSRLLDQRRGRRPWPLAAALAASAAAGVVALAAVAPLSAVIVLVNAGPNRAIEQMALMSRGLVVDTAWLRPSTTTTPGPIASPATARQVVQLDTTAPMPRELAESSFVPTGVSVAMPPASVVAPPLEALSPTSSLFVLTAAPIVLGDGRSIPLPGGSSRGAVPDAPARSPWGRVAEAGTAVGAGAKAAGLATAGFFGRTGVSVARAF